MRTLLCFGFGYTAQHYAAAYHDRFQRVFGTVRGQQRSPGPIAGDHPWLTTTPFDLSSPDFNAAIAAATDILMTAAPDETSDPVLAACGDALLQAPNLQSVVYLSTIGVYGDSDAWLDEESERWSSLERNLQRLEAERAWQAFGARKGVPVAILRLAGIYGPGRNSLVTVQQGVARRINNPGQVFNRIHVADIARTIDAAFQRRASGIFNVADDEPTPAGDPVVFAAKLLGFEPPPEVPFAEARRTLSPFALTFYAERKRVKNAKIKSELGVELQFPTYREGLTALFHERKGAA
ncbi:MAG: NAD-dependent epimerase/dehydratase family protein [Bradyrhizobiaceae bacterium]|nr:NAD-dependent epimerase/dehydratase family protein [Bradyrhizobiaceae bacterium]